MDGGRKGKDERMIRKCLATAALAAALFGLTQFGLTQSAMSESSETYRQLNLFGDVFERIRGDYVEEPEDAELIEAAINGMLSSLDPHSSYLNPKNFRDMQVQTRGEFGGLGIEVTMEDGLVKVVSPIDDTPAAKAGLKAGDLVTHLDGEPVLGLTLAQAVEKMRGPVKSAIVLTIARQDVEKPFEVTIVRDVIQIQSVRQRVEGDIGYLRVTSFNEQTMTALRRGINRLNDEIGAGLRGFVVDLRNNPGGLLDQAVAVSDAFLEQGEIVSTRGRRAEDAQRFNAKEGDLAEGKPIVVLINGGSASASEIVAGALQDHRRAIVLGTKSFGKGSVQTIIPLQGHGAIRLTTARYYTPSGRSIQARGIEPDIEVQQVGEQTAAQQRRSEADLRHHLEVVADDDPSQLEGKVTDRDAEAKEPEAEPAKAAPQATGAEGEQKDLQLAYALDLIRGIKTSQRARD
jgi:carboxyl-terminal processing protease